LIYPSTHLTMWTNTGTSILITLLRFVIMLKKDVHIFHPGQKNFITTFRILQKPPAPTRRSFINSERSEIRLKNTVRNLFPQISKSSSFTSLSYSFAKIKDHPERGGPMWPLRFTYCLYKLEWGSIYRLSDRFSCHNTCPYCIRFWLFSWLSFFRRWH